MIQTNFKGPGEEIKIENEHYTLFNLNKKGEFT